MSEYAKNIQTIEDIWKKRIELPEIVRCRDCKYYDDYTGCCTRRDNVAPMAVTPDGFCAWAERREP